MTLCRNMQPAHGRSSIHLPQRTVKDGAPAEGEEHVFFGQPFAASLFAWRRSMRAGGKSQLNVLP
jgi:hypothetical protein